MQAWATGSNDYGQLGLGDTTDYRSTPEQLPSPTNIVQVAAGSSHTVLVDGSGLVRLLLVLSVACRREPERVVPVCARASFVLLFGSRVVYCACVGESVAGLGRHLHRTVVTLCVARSRLIAPASCTALALLALHLHC